MERDPNLPSYTELNPLKSMRPQLIRKGYIIPACLGIIGMFAAMIGKNGEIWFLTAGLIVAGEMGLIYSLCGKRKPWWSMAGTIVGTAILLRALAPIVGTLNSLLIYKYDGLTVLIGPGLIEELFKSIPVFALALYSRTANDPPETTVGVVEPLDGILIGAAAGFGFALTETFLQYANSRELIMWRFLSNIFGHAAYSGYFGYFIGLAAMRRRDSLRTIGMGLAFSFFVHNAWDFFAANGMLLGLIPVAILSYAGFVAAILKAREISPRRLENFATRRVDPPRAPAAAQPVWTPPPAGISLMGLAGPAAGERFRMSPQTLKVGRDPATCQIVLPDGTGKISKVHCLVGIDPSGPGLFLEDNHSTNGTFLGSGERVLPGQRMRLACNATFYLSTPAVMFQVIAE
jgi:RsiW-degrading membrane proteinase PrsW (M82 family)